MIELLSPVGDFECLKAAVQNGANAVYFGAESFSARAYATNFDNIDLENAINYAKLRGVKTHLALNTLIKNTEFKEAFEIAKKAYKYGIDAIIVQDLGLAKKLISSFPDLDIHASTQMTTTNIEEVKTLKELGFKRIVLSRECSLSEIENICKNTDVEIEVFIHGALCICYSGQCLFSSMVGGRSGNRGQCAQPCRLPYSLISGNNIDEYITNDASTTLDKGYLLSTKDICGLENLPDLISYGVTSLKIEGRMKSPSYVATVTRIYRKYIDLATKYTNHEIEKYEIDENDKKALMQVFNRGGFSSGHLEDNPNKELVYPQKPNNMGIYLGKIIKYNPNKGLVTAKIETPISIGDGISFENEPTTKYTISELMHKNENIKKATTSQIVTFGRMKGNIHINDKIFKITDKELVAESLNSFSKENIKTKLNCNIEIKQGKTIKVFAESKDFNVKENFEYNYIPDTAKNAPITIEKIKEQFGKTLNTCFEFSNIEIDLDDNLFIPTSVLNEIRRQTISHIEDKIIESFKRKFDYNIIENPANVSTINSSYEIVSNSKVQEKSILLNILNLDYDYSKLKPVDRIYVPLKYFTDKKYSEIINTLSTKSKLYIYMPLVIKDRFVLQIQNALDQTFKSYKIYGCVVSELASIRLLEYFKTDLIANYNFNVYNSYTTEELNKLGISIYTPSPELDYTEIQNLKSLNKEVIVYGKIPLMTMSYCLLGKSNRCYKECKHLCLSDKKYYLKDRYEFKFRLIPDNTQTITTIYNSRNIKLHDVESKSIRFDFLEETIEEINTMLS